MELYNNVSKHSNYQVLSSLITDNMSIENIETNSRYEKERFDYIKKHIQVDGKKILDIGGNTGFFTFESIKEGARGLTYVEGNYEHAMFVSEIAKLLGVENITVLNQYFDFDKLINAEFDVTYLLNVLHHVGDDFGDNKISIIEAKKQILNYINNMAKITKYMIFQLGFNWKGNRDICLFEHGEKQEMIDYIEQGTNENWSIEDIGVSTGNDYVELDETNIKRIDDIGEFRNRPIFVMKSKIKRI